MEIYLNFRLDVLSSQAKKNADRIYEEECGLGVNVLRLLRLISLQPGIGPSELADLARFDRPKTSRMLTRLTDMGLVQRSAASGSGQVVRLEVTRKGKKVFDHAQEVGDRLEAALVAPLSGEELRSLIASLDKLTKWVEEGRELEMMYRKQESGSVPTETLSD